MLVPIPEFKNTASGKKSQIKIITSSLKKFNPLSLWRIPITIPMF